MKNKKSIVAIIALVVVIALMATAYFVTRPDAVEGSKNVTVVIVHKDGTTKELS